MVEGSQPQPQPQVLGGRAPACDTQTTPREVRRELQG